jgi:probable rRNA maturation factor
MIVVQFAKPRTTNHKLRRLVRFVCKRFGLTSATVSVAVVDDAQFRRLNAQFLKRTCSSDCLSFDLSEPKSKDRTFELVINGDAAAIEAGRRGHSPEAELALYVVHGLLHQLGFNDSATRQAHKMHKAEDEILRSLGYGAVWNTEYRTQNAEPAFGGLRRAGTEHRRKN